MFHGQKKPPKWPHGHSSKHKRLIDLLEQHPDEGTLVFCQFTEEMDMLEDFVMERGHRCLRLDGKLNNSERAEVLKQCRDTDGVPPVTLIQIKAGGVGLNLQAFSRVYILSPDWNPCNEIQAMARSHRIGQTRRVEVKRIVLESTDELSVIDDRIMVVQERKRDLMADLLEEESLRCNGRRRKIGLTNTDFARLLKA
jgi:SNF2 family DNA or RNA helicase